MCRVLVIERTGRHAWLAAPVNPRAKEITKLIAQIKQSWLEGGCVYGYRNITKERLASPLLQCHYTFLRRIADGKKYTKIHLVINFQLPKSL